MTSPSGPSERERPAPERKQEESAASSRRARADNSISSDSIGERLWVLPTASGTPWTVIEQRDPWAMSEAMRAAPPAILAPSDEGGRKLVDSARDKVQSKLLDRFQEAVFNFGTRFVLGLAWMLVAVGSLRIPGEAKIFGDILLLCGVGFTAYTVMRYGYGVVRWHNRRVDSAHAFAGASVQSHPLAARLAAALELRKKLKADERGKSPDEELLDSNAYRKLIDDGVTSVKELTTLGHAIENQLGLVGPDGAVRKIADVARDAGLDTDTAIFYRDVAAAASDIELQERARIDG